MHTSEELKEEIADLKEITEDIGRIVSNIKAGAMSSAGLNYLEKSGIEKLCADVYERIERLDTDIDEIVGYDLCFPEKKQAV